MKILNFIKKSALMLLPFLLVSCCTEKVIKDKMQCERPDRIVVAGIEMVKIPDNIDHIGLYFSKYEVTQAQWQQIMGNNPSFFISDPSRPVESISWDDCQKFIEKLNLCNEAKQNEIEFFLPTREEWEYACRAGSSGQYGLIADGREGTIDEMGWCRDNSGDTTHPVGQKMPNKWGLYDMHGNVYEWTASSPNGIGRFLCGGSCYSDATFCKASDWFWLNPDNKSDCLGLRIACQFKNPK